MKKELVCINCPAGCLLSIEFDNKIISVSGNRCKSGLEYSEKEIFHPERIVTTTVKIKKSLIKMLPCKTNKTIPKALTDKIIKEASHITAVAPVKTGDILIKNIINTGADLVATRNALEEQ